MHHWIVCHEIAQLIQFQVQGPRKNISSRVQMKDFKLKVFIKLLFRNGKFYMVEAINNTAIWLETFVNIFVFHHLILLR